MTDLTPENMLYYHQLTPENHSLLLSRGYEFDNYWGCYKVTAAGKTVWIDFSRNDMCSVTLVDDQTTNDILIAENITDLTDYLKSLEVVFFQGQ